MQVYHDITHREIKTGTEFDDLAEAELMDWLRQVRGPDDL